MNRSHSHLRRSGGLMLESSVSPRQASDFYVDVVRRPKDLTPYLSDWAELVGKAAEPNPFYEPWMLLPALEAYGNNADLSFVFVYRRKAIRANGPPLLVGFFPLENKCRYKQLPVRALKLYEYDHCFLDTPLIHADFGKECLESFFNWAHDDSHGAPIVEMGQVTAEGRFHHFLIDHCFEKSRLHFVDENATRALFCRASDNQSYLQSALSTKLRKELRRQKKRLSELGRLEIRQLQSADELADWLDDFRKLEHSGWKGRQGTSFEATESDRTFFDSIGRDAFARGKLMMVGYFLDERPIALKFNFVTPPGSFSFKIAYDESLAKYSPGVLLELENIARLHHMPEVEWMDSCAAWNHPMINRLWKDRRSIQTIAISTGKPPGDMVVSLLPLLRWFRRWWGGKTNDGAGN